MWQQRDKGADYVLIPGARSVACLMQRLILRPIFWSDQIVGQPPRQMLIRLLPPMDGKWTKF